MRLSLKCLVFVFILSTIIFNLHLFYQLYSTEDSFDDDSFQLQSTNVEEKETYGNNDFLVLDWTAGQHIFQEQKNIACDFSFVNVDYCQSKLGWIVNNTLRSYLIKRCTRLQNVTVRWSKDRRYLKQANIVAYHSIHMPQVRLPKLMRNDDRQQYSTVYVMESEVYSTNGEHWHNIDFPMWYNLERSYPAPATYFDLKLYLNFLFRSVKVSFSNKTTSAPVVWIISNCNAYNGRQLFVRTLMSYIAVDSYGACLKNIDSIVIKSSRQSNLDLYASYKFVIAIENSNCEDYVSEKFIEAISSTSVPIVASRREKPDYLRFAPKHSYINVYDFKSVKHLANYLKYLSTNQTAYEEYLWYRRLPANEYVMYGVVNRSLSKNLRLADDILGSNSPMRQWLLTKETSVNKYCKLVHHIYTNYWKTIVEREKIDRPKPKEVCLPKYDLPNFFSLNSH